MLLRLTEAPFRNKKSQRDPCGEYASVWYLRWTSVLPIVRPHSRKTFLNFSCASLDLDAFLHLGMDGLSAFYGDNNMAVVHLPHQPKYLIVLSCYSLCRILHAYALRPVLFHELYRAPFFYLKVFFSAKKDPHMPCGSCLY